ncbi:MAG: 23S rRNA (uracil(1939)-C(5))-methyltransferase RlmD [Chlamydiae bacterium]|nr:23S rRNA (uracil-C(5))-methyltransferase RlmCD [Chlamydiales bacterium]MCH9703591.1 23S rRNA (uracil(1939)-C(5))-methyltransferase RlmD [Chlamydiota bacterium]
MQSKIRTLNSSGEGIGQTDEGKTLFIDGALPGETVEYEIELEKKSYAKGTLLKIIEPTKERVHPPCPVFGTCGGCQIQHLDYQEQLEIKRMRVQDALRRIAKIDIEVPPCIPSPMPFGYRNKIQLPHKDGLLGLYKKRSHELVPIKGCPIQSALGEKILRFLQNRLPNSVSHLLIRNGIFTNEALVVFITSGEAPTALAKELFDEFEEIKGVVLNIKRGSGNRILGSSFKTLAGRDHIFEQLGSLKFKLSAPSFFQVNSWQALNLFKTVADQITGKRVIDAFCGVGTLALFAAQKCQSLLGIECVKEAISDARENAKLNGIQNCHFEVGRAEERHLECDTLLLNPPRGGLDPKIFEKIKAKQIIYISCDPATLSRDLLNLKDFNIRFVQPFDMFPQTTHVETLITLF